MDDETLSPFKAEKQAVDGFITSLQPPYTPNNGTWLSIPSVKTGEDHILQLIPDTECETLEKPQVQRLKNREDQHGSDRGVHKYNIHKSSDTAKTLDLLWQG